MNYTIKYFEDRVKELVLSKYFVPGKIYVCGNKNCNDCVLYHDCFPNVEPKIINYKDLLKEHYPELFI